MREDMFKVIVERPRRLGGKRQKVRLKGRWREELGRLDEMAWKRERIRQNTECIYLNENLAPLRRFLHSRVGRKWNDVFSEICENLSVRSAVQLHVREHLDDFVALHVERVNGRLRPKIASRWTHARYAWHLRQPLYVDPDSGVLRVNAKWRKDWRFSTTSAPPPEVRKLDEMHELRRIDGLWFEIAYLPLPDYPVWDLVERRWIKVNEPRPMNGGRYAARKRQLNSRELREHALTPV